VSRDAPSRRALPAGGGTPPAAAGERGPQVRREQGSGGARNAQESTGRCAVTRKGHRPSRRLGGRSPRAANGLAQGRKLRSRRNGRTEVGPAHEVQGDREVSRGAPPQGGVRSGAEREPLATAGSGQGRRPNVARVGEGRGDKTARAAPGSDREERQGSQRPRRGVRDLTRGERSEGRRQPRDGSGAQQTRELERSQETGEGVRNPGVGTAVDPDGPLHTGPERGTSSKGKETSGSRRRPQNGTASREDARDSGGASPLA
jgi:hypothetical protein